MSVENNKRAKKMQKKCNKGEIHTLDNYFECRDNNIQATPSIVFMGEQSRMHSKFDLHLSELRSLLLSLTLDKPVAKYFEMKNKPFIRSVVHLHVSDCPDMPSVASGIDCGSMIRTKVNRSNDNDVTFLPLKLLTIALDEADALDNPSKSTPTSTLEEESKREIVASTPDYVKRLSEFVLAPSQMKLWGFPLRNIDRSVGGQISSMTDEPAPKKAKIDSRDIPGLMVGQLPSQTEADAFLSQYGNVRSDSNTEFSVESLSKRVLRHESPLSIAAIDCEMVVTSSGWKEIARVTVVDQDSTVVLDVLVKPLRNIINYVTNYSGITEKLLTDVTTTLAQVQVALLRLISSETLLIGHSLDSDLRALHFTHDRCIDTALLFPHPKGFPLRYSLKQLSANYLQMRIQEGSNGHDSAEDARAALRLALLKADNGPLFGLNKGVEGRLPLSKYWKREEIRSMLSCQGYIHDLNNTRLDANKREAESVGTDTISVEGSVDDDSNADTSSTTIVEPVLSYPHGLDAVIVGEMAAAVSATADEAVVKAANFLMQCKCSSADGTYQKSEDKINLVTVAVKYKSMDELKQHITVLEGVMKQTGSHGLILITVQKSFAVAFKLKKQKKMCLNNLMSSVVWNKENEMRLQHQIGECNLAGLLLKIV